jgi:tail lysozyme
VGSRSTHGSKRKIRRTGRHAARSQKRSVAMTAVRAGPAVAVIGVLAAAPQVHDLLASATTSGAGGHPAAAPMMPPSPVVNDAADNPATSGNAQRRLWPRPTATAGPGARRRHAPARSGAAAHPGAVASGRHAASPGPSPSPAGAASSGSSASSGGPGPRCTAGASGPLPQNYAAIVDFLTAHGYTGLAAAGIAGNIYQESGGNPESVGDGGGGLIGWTPLPAGYVTGNPAADLQTQLNAVLTFNQQWAQFIPALNAATSAAQAADIYVQDFERAGIPAASNREAAARAVAAACGL